MRPESYVLGVLAGMLGTFTVWMLWVALNGEPVAVPFAVLGLVGSGSAHAAAGRLGGNNSQ